jgi:biotin synthesis protein BioG
MKSCWLHRGQSDKLILFCGGWGMDKYPFAPVTCHDWDVLMFYDYCDFHADLDISTLFTEYRDVVLVSWSMGVWAGQQIFHPFAHLIRDSLAMNGTLCPADDRFGIPEEVVKATHAKLNEKQRLKFYQRSCKDRALYHGFLDNQPRRSVESQKKELAALLKNVRELPCDEPSIYHHALVGNDDLIMPTKNQLRYWPEEMVQRVAGAHFLFYGFGSWESILVAGRIEEQA